MINDLSVATIKDFRVALAEHARTFVCDDKPILDALAVDSNGQRVMDAAALQWISRQFRLESHSYWVEGKSSKAIIENTQNYVSELNRFVLDWPQSFLDRASKCAELSRWAAGHGITKNLKTSAASKFLWFVRPEGWIMYDRYVKAALKGQGKDSADTMVNCFKELDSLGYNTAVSELEVLFKQHDIGFLYPGRVIDKFLMGTGGYPLHASISMIPLNDPIAGFQAAVAAVSTAIEDAQETCRFLQNVQNFRSVRRRIKKSRKGV
jgi:hypothetical protein